MLKAGRPSLHYFNVLPPPSFSYLPLSVQILNSTTILLHHSSFKSTTSAVHATKLTSLCSVPIDARDSLVVRIRICTIPTTMPLSTSTVSELTEVAARLDLLLTIPDVKRKKTSSEERKECSACDEHYDDVPWKPDDISNFLVKLQCGHNFHCRVSLIYIFPSTWIHWRHNGLASRAESC